MKSASTINVDPLDGMCEALASINHILRYRQQPIDDKYNRSVIIEKEESEGKRSINTLPTSNASIDVLETITAPQLMPVINAHESKIDRLHFDPLTEDNFYRAHLCNRSVDELPIASVRDIKQLKSINIYTVQDLLGRFLIHDTPEEFHIFLTKTFQLSEKTATTITHLLNIWTKYNLDSTISSRAHTTVDNQ